ncbi:unnamed protein product [Orchesella dallaii]|uniref:Uncharacterized protein n=1 Tax=Orchesella dallaii TaxID=48710 RepID=A0ABP1PJU5_9HEXA
MEHGTSEQKMRWDEMRVDKKVDFSWLTADPLRPLFADKSIWDPAVLCVYYYSFSHLLSLRLYPGYGEEEWRKEVVPPPPAVGASFMDVLLAPNTNYELNVKDIRRIEILKLETLNKTYSCHSPSICKVANTKKVVITVSVEAASSTKASRM